MEAWLGRADLPEPFCLVWCLVNPHDVLGYPSSFEAGGYAPEEFADLRMPAAGDHRRKSSRQADRAGAHPARPDGVPRRAARAGAQQRYLDFYAHLHRLVDEKIGRLLRLLGDPADPASLRARTVVVRTSDHGELALSHGGLRQKMFNAYEEAIRVPLVVSGPALFPRRARATR